MSRTHNNFSRNKKILCEIYLAYFNQRTALLFHRGQNMYKCVLFSLFFLSYSAGVLFSPLLVLTKKSFKAKFVDQI